MLHFLAIRREMRNRTRKTRPGEPAAAGEMIRERKKRGGNRILTANPIFDN